MLAGSQALWDLEISRRHVVPLSVLSQDLLGFESPTREVALKAWIRSVVRELMASSCVHRGEGTCAAMNPTRETKAGHKCSVITLLYVRG